MATGLLERARESRRVLDRAVRLLPLAEFDPGQKRDGKGRWVKWKLGAGDVLDHFKDTGAIDADTAAAVAEVYTIEHGGLSTSDITLLGRVGPDGERYVAVRGKIRNQQGVEVGRFGRYLLTEKDGALTASHGLLELDKNVRGQGFAGAFNAQAFDWYRESGVQRVQLLANIDVGGYAWARAGYDWSDPDDVKKIRTRALRLSSKGSVRIPAERRDEQMRLAGEMAARLREAKFGGDDYPTPFEVSQLGRWEGAGKDDWWAGKAIMMGSTWSAVTTP